MNAGFFYWQVNETILIFACCGLFQDPRTTVPSHPYISLLSPQRPSQSSRGRANPPRIVRPAQAGSKPKPRREQSDPEPQSPSPTLPAFVKQAILFPSDSALLDLTSQQELLQIAGWLRQHRQIRVLVVGFCDPLGSESCTHLLAAQRAGEVGRFLLSEGVDTSRIMAMAGWEKADPVCRGETPGCQQQNRRARVFVSFSPYGEGGLLQETLSKTDSRQGGH